MNYACAETLLQTHTHTHKLTYTQTCCWFIMHIRQDQVDRQHENELAKRKENKQKIAIL